MKAEYRKPQVEQRRRNCRKILAEMAARRVVKEVFPEYHHRLTLQEVATRLDLNNEELHRRIEEKSPGALPFAAIQLMLDPSTAEEGGAAPP